MTTFTTDDRIAAESDPNDYDYERYELIMKRLMEDSEAIYIAPEDLRIGENISAIPAVKIIFDGFADLETEDDYIEGGDHNQRSFAVFIHRGAEYSQFEFPEHDMTPWCLVHRPADEVCIYAWYDALNDSWQINSLEETSEHEMTNSEVMRVLDSINEHWFADQDVPESEQVNIPTAGWPFQTGADTK